ncbi:MAG: BtpA/SgcQ family protein [Phycisphaerae bacterium]
MSRRNDNLTIWADRAYLSLAARVFTVNFSLCTSNCVRAGEYHATMSKHTLPAWQSIEKVVIGMCHCPALPGSPNCSGYLAPIREHVLRDARALASGGVHGIMLENFGDVPFYPGRVPAHVVAHLTAIAAMVKQETKLPLGINVLRNDGISALAVAHAADADFIRVNVLSHARLTDQGVLQAIAHDLLRERMLLGATNIQILADVDAKESVPLAPGLSLEDEIDDVTRRGLADGIVVSGANTGGAADPSKVGKAYAAAGKTPVFIGSGVRAANIEQYMSAADGFIVGTSLKGGGDVRAAIDVNLVRELMQRVR